MEQLVFSLNAIVPIFLVIVLGYILKLSGLMDEDFTDKASKIVFKTALPVLVFDKVFHADIKMVLSEDMGNVLLYGSATSIGISIVIFFIAKMTMKGKGAVGAFTQGTYRSNYAIIGLSIMLNLFGDEGASRIAVMLVPIMIINNVTAVLYLSFSSGKEKSNFISIIKKIVTNPLIIAIIMGFILNITSITIPLFVTKTYSYLSNLATPLALLSIGAFLDINKARQKLKTAMIAACIKLVIIPLIFTCGAYLIGIKGIELVVLYILYSTPTAASSFVMAKAMSNDADLAASIVVLTTSFSIITIFIGVYVLKIFQII